MIFHIIHIISISTNIWLFLRLFICFKEINFKIIRNNWFEENETKSDHKLLFEIFVIIRKAYSQKFFLSFFMTAIT
jgi:hypothetical protein